MHQVRFFKQYIISVFVPILFLISLTAIAKADDEIKRSYYDDGTLKEETSYRDGKLHGVSKAYYEDGVLKREATYEDGRPEGVGRTYHRNGQLKSEVHFKDGKRHDSRKVYDEKGRLLFEENYNMGKRDGVLRTYDAETGKPLSIHSFKNGELHGRYVAYRPGGLKGEKFIEGNYVDGKLEGESLRYSVLDGSLVVEASNYKDGKLNGLVTYYYDKNSSAPGKIERTETYKDGLLEGPTTYYDEKGKKILVEYYQNGEKVR